MQIIKEPSVEQADIFIKGEFRWFLFKLYQPTQMEEQQYHALQYFCHFELTTCRCLNGKTRLRYVNTENVSWILKLALLSPICFDFTFVVEQTYQTHDLKSFLFPIDQKKSKLYQNQFLRTCGLISNPKAQSKGKNCLGGSNLIQSKPKTQHIPPKTITEWRTVRIPSNGLWAWALTTDTGG